MCQIWRSQQPITKALSLREKLIDAQLSQTNGLIAKALVPIVHCISDIGDKKGHYSSCYLDGLITLT